jgi:hypothetical protein
MFKKKILLGLLVLVVVVSGGHLNSFSLPADGDYNYKAQLTVFSDGHYYTELYHIFDLLGSESTLDPENNSADVTPLDNESNLLINSVPFVLLFLVLIIGVLLIRRK